MTTTTTPKSNEDRDTPDERVPEPGENAYPDDSYWEAESKDERVQNKRAQDGAATQDPARENAPSKRGPARADNEVPDHVKDS